MRRHYPRLGCELTPPPPRIGAGGGPGEGMKFGNGMPTMKTRSMIGRSLPILAMGMLSGCCTSPVGECIPLRDRCPAPILQRDIQSVAWIRPCNYPVTRRYYPTLAGQAPRQMLTGSTQVDLGVRVRPYFRPWGIEPVGERIYYRTPYSPFGGGRVCDPVTQRWERLSPYRPNSLTSLSQWW